MRRVPDKSRIERAADRIFLGLARLGAVIVALIGFVQRARRKQAPIPRPPHAAGPADRLATRATDLLASPTAARLAGRLEQFLDRAFARWL